jgi:tetratricopeptide (TPR) repeat protein
LKHSTKYKIMYFFSVIFFFGISLLYGVYKNSPVIPVITLIMIFFVPSMIQGFFWNNFFLGRRYLKNGLWKKSIDQFLLFIKELNDKPMLKYFNAIRWPIYTASVEAMAWSNIGLAYINIFDFDEAARCFNKALSLDSDYPVPYFNLAIIALINKKESEAEKLWKKSQELGYSKEKFSNLKEFAKVIKDHKKNK